MKKLTLGLCIASIAMASCSREYICQCKVKYSGKVPGLPDSTFTEAVIKNTLNKAKEECTKNSASTTLNGVTMTQTCDLY